MRSLCTIGARWSGHLRPGIPVPVPAQPDSPGNALPDPWAIPASCAGRPGLTHHSGYLRGRTSTADRRCRRSRPRTGRGLVRAPPPSSPHRHRNWPRRCRCGSCRPRPVDRPPRGIGDVILHRQPPLLARSLHVGPAIAGRSAEIHLQHRIACRRQHLCLGVVGAVVGNADRAPCGTTTIGSAPASWPCGTVRKPCSGRPSRAFRLIGRTCAASAGSIQSLRLIRCRALLATVS